MQEGMNGLSRSVTIGILEKYSRQGIVSIFVQTVVFPAIVLSSPEMRETPISWIAFGGLMVVAALRLVQRRWKDRIFAFKHGILLWRLWYNVTSQWIALMWGASACYSVMTFGITPLSTRVIIGTFGVVSWTAASFTFDWANILVYQFVIMIPLITGLYLSGNTFLAISSVLYFLYGLKVSYGLHKSEVELINKTELAQDQYRRLRQNHEFINAMLGSIDESFITLDGEGVCTGSASAVTKTFFGEKTAGVHFADLLGLTGKANDDARGWYRLLFTDRVDFQDLSAKGPSLVEMKNGQLILQLKYHPMRDEKGQLSAVIFTAVDVTGQVHAQRSLDAERERASLIVRIHENRSLFRSFLGDLEACFERLTKAEGPSVETLRRNLHTLKGTAMLFGAGSLAKTIYASEVAIGKDPQGLVERMQEQGRCLHEYFAKWRQNEMALFTQIGVFEGETIEISRRKLKSLEEEFSRSRDLSSTISSTIHAFTNRMIESEFGDLLRDFEFHVNSVAGKLGKKVRFDVASPSEPIYAAPTAYREVTRSFVHLFNNAIDHGLESPEERRLCGKPEEGQLTIRYDRIHENQKPMIRILIEDDGRGINIPRLRELLKKAGSPKAETASDLEIASHIFSGGVSTRDTVTELSGQGVGMGAVRAAVLNVRGKIRIARTDQSGTSIEILIPEKPALPVDRAVGAA